LGRKRQGNTLHGCSTNSVWEAKTNRFKANFLNISQEEHVQQYRRDNKVLLSELGEQELKPKGESTTSVFLYLVPV
jgi:hypothetical protein